MEQWIYGEENFRAAKRLWGTETELAIFPQAAQYLERDFIWRLSIMQTLEEEASLTKLSDYERVFSVIEGETVLAFGDRKTVRLTAREQAFFDGSVKTKCFGKVKGCSLMVRKGCRGRLWHLDAGSDAVAAGQNAPQEGESSSYGVYCLSGYVIVSVCGKTHMVREGKQLVLDIDAGETASLTVMGEGQALLAEVFYRRQAHVAEEIPPQKASFDDFKTAFWLSCSRNKWRQAVAAKKDVWYDEALQRKLALLDKSYLGLIIWAAGFVILLAAAFAGHSHLLAAVLAACWFVLYVLLVSPLLYLLLLPKPIRAHIKKAGSLTEYERKRYEQQQRENPLTDHIFKKYKYSGKERWDEDYQTVFQRLKK